MLSNTLEINTILSLLPHKPGIYQFFDEGGKIIYVGKAKDLKKRVSSYFNREHDSAKTAMLVKKTKDIRYLLADTELDALLLENNLIKEHQPRYNILLKDDKTYPWICIKNEAFPRVFHTRNLVKDGSAYFGPYASGKVMHTLLDLIRQLYKLRSCSLLLSPENIARKKFKVCLEYHIGNCLGPCEGLQTEEEYNNDIAQVRAILKGNIAGVLRQLKTMMLQNATDLEFEKAHLLKEKIDQLEKFQARSTIVSPVHNNIDVFSISDGDSSAFVNYLRIADGAIVQGHTVELKKKLDETPADMLAYAITDLRQRFESESKEIVLPLLPEYTLPGVEYTIPQRGEKKKLLELSQRNADHYRREKELKDKLASPALQKHRVLKKLRDDLRMKELPRHIECFDNSNIQGTYPVAACVVFKDGKPSKKDYRHFNIKTVEGPDDFASMEEVIYRRYKRMLDEDSPLPQLVIIDGGKGQLSSAMASMDRLGLIGKIAVISIAKKLEEIFFPGDPIPLYIDKRSESLRLIQHLRNEAHRFGLTHHRARRSKGTIRSELTSISGISDITARKLLYRFKSVKRIKGLSLETLAKEIGEAKAKLVFEHFNAR